MLSIQFLKYATIGLSRSVLGYILYLALTFIGIEHKLAMTLLYINGVAISYFANRKWTFNDNGNLSRSAPRFLLVYGIGYIINLVILLIFVDYLHFPHQLVQPVAIVIVAAFLFTMLKLFVFNKNLGLTESTVQRYVGDPEA